MRFLLAPRSPRGRRSGAEGLGSIHVLALAHFGLILVDWDRVWIAFRSLINRCYCRSRSSYTYQIAALPNRNGLLGAWRCRQVVVRLNE